MEEIPSTIPAELGNIFLRWITWFRLRRALGLVFPGLLFGLGTALGFSLVILGQSILVLSSFVLLAIASGFAGMGIFALAGFLWRTTPEEATRFFDRHFGLFERASTALELSRSLDTETHKNNLVARQIEDALDKARQVEPDLRFFIRFTRQQLGLLIAILMALVAVAVVSQPLFEQAQARKAVQQAIEQEVTALETLKEEIKAMENLTPQQRLEITKELDKVIAELQNAKTLEQALAAMQQGEANLQSLDNARIQQQSSDLKQAGQELLNQAEGSQDLPLNDFANELAAGDFAQAAETLSSLDLESMSEEERETLADQLEQTADAVAESNPELAQQLQSAAESIRQGEASAAQQALTNASQSLSTTANQAAQAGVARQAAVQVDQASDRLLQAGLASQSSGSQSSGAESSASGQGQGQGQGTGSGSSSNGENSGVGSGSGSGSSPGSDAQGGEAGSDPIDQGNGPGDGGEKPYEEVFSPQRLGGSAGETVTLPPSTTMDQILGLSGSNPGQDSASTVPYQSISPSLVDAYRKYSSSGEIPPALRDYIKYYYYNLAQP